MSFEATIKALDAEINRLTIARDSIRRLMEPERSAMPKTRIKRASTRKTSESHADYAARYIRQNGPVSTTELMKQMRKDKHKCASRNSLDNSLKENARKDTSLLSMQDGKWSLKNSNVTPLASNAKAA